jgi:hypothetical protein
VGEVQIQRDENALLVLTDLGNEGVGSTTQIFVENRVGIVPFRTEDSA